MKVVKGINPNIEKYYFDTVEEWLAFRKNHIGASDASIIMGVSKWKTNDGRIKTPLLLWKEKLGLDNINCDNSATRYGKRMEEPARQEYQKMVGDLFEPVCIKNKKYPHSMVSLDGLNVTEGRAVEIKNCSKEDHLLAKEGIVPAKYYPQVQMQSMVTELPYIDYFSFYNGEGVIVKAERDEEYQLHLIDKLNEFWNYVVELKEPPLTDDDLIEQGNEWHEIAQLLHDVKQQKKTACDKEKVLSEKLKLMSKYNNSFSKEFRYTCSISPGIIDYKAIPELSNRDLSEFRGKPITKWLLKKRLLKKAAS